VASEPFHQSGGRWRARLASLLHLQEAGLILVILILGGALTLLGGTKDKPRPVDLAPGDTWSAEPFRVTERRVDRETGELQRVPVNHYRVTVTRADGSTREFISVRDPRERELNGGRVLFLNVRTNRFLDFANIVILANNASYIAVMAVGMTAVIVLAGIDLSVGSIYALAAIAGASALAALSPETGLFLSLLVGVGACCVVGALCGLANGIMVVGLRVHPFVITLGTMAIYRGVVFVSTRGQSVSGFPDGFQEEAFKASLTVAGTDVFPVPTLIMIGVALVGSVLLTRTVLGRRVFAIGGNETAARYAGVPVGHVKTIVYTLMGLLAGVSAVMYIGYFGAAEPNAGNAYELRVIAAAVIGGASLSGGRGSAIGAVLGAVIVEMINNGMLILEIDQSYTQIVMGGAIIVAVVVDQLKTRLLPGR